MLLGKILGSWSGMRKYLEQEMLADSLKGRIRYGCTAYVGMDGCRIFEVCIDGKQVKRFSLETVNTYFIDNGFTENNNPIGTEEYWQDFWRLLNGVTMNERSEYTDEEFCNALKAYRSQSIEQSIASDDPIVRMFAILDRRLGKRTLLRIKTQLNSQPEWLRHFYTLRITAEDIETAGIG